MLRPPEQKLLLLLTHIELCLIGENSTSNMNIEICKKDQYEDQDEYKDEDED